MERAHSIQAAKCPLCRASILDGRRPEAATTRNIPPPQAPVVENNLAQPQQTHTGEHALFRFSSEDFVPSWLPWIPAFSFEVIRRASSQPVTTAAPSDALEQEQEQTPQGREEDGTNDDNQDSNHQPIADQTLHHRHGEEGVQPSFFRRFLVLAGAIPMSPEEEARALGQLTDMFPQYDRSDLLRELRARGSAEAVAEAVLIGVAMIEM